MSSALAVVDSRCISPDVFIAGGSDPAAAAAAAVRWASESDSLSSIMAEQSDSPAAVQTPQPALTTSWPIVKEAYELQEVIGG